ncbi:HEPN domain-containing protein [Methanococcus maripaludis]|uniref:ApeA N-terminal domain-containing protein n=2 Tax=Methanococcus maripaludis TaxID=39152 RepID=A0A7J9PJJ0_METMI|nr:HEPN domain-containing protein [Methanococcus maripaludis]MBA2862898.1 hypothetical protein [Methanococcus maripaludis]
MKELTCRGKWIIPGDKKEVYGTLNYTSSEKILDLIEVEGNFSNIMQPGQIIDPILIKGHTEDGKYLTVEGYPLNLKYRGLGYNTAKFNVTKVYYGKYFPNREELNFKKVMVKFYNLREWSCIVGYLEYIRAENTYGASCEVPDPLYLGTFEDFKFYIGMHFDGSFVQNCSFSIDIDFKLIIEHENGDLVNFSKYLDIIKSFEKFLSFSIGSRVYPHEIIGSIPKGEKDAHIDIYLEELHEKPPKKIINSDNMLFNNSHENMESIFTKWFEIEKRLKPIFNLYFSTKKFNMPLAYNFISLCYALESYHRQTRINERLPIDEYNTRVEEIKDVFSMKDSRYKRWLDGKLRGNEPSLADRLRELLKEYLPQWGNNTIHDFSEFVAHNRNGLSHEAALRAENHSEIYHATKKLEILLELCIMEEIGFEKEEILKIFHDKIRLEFEIGV